MKKIFEFVQHIGKWRVLVQSRDINDAAITENKIADSAVRFRHLSEDALEGIKAWLKEHEDVEPEPEPQPQPTNDIRVYYGFADPDQISGVEGLESRLTIKVAGEYNVQNPTDGYQFFMAVPSGMTINEIKVGVFYFPIREDGTFTVDGKTYKRYVTDGDDMGYQAGSYPFVVS